MTLLYSQDNSYCTERSIESLHHILLCTPSIHWSEILQIASYVLGTLQPYIYSRQLSKDQKVCQHPALTISGTATELLLRNLKLKC